LPSSSSSSSSMLGPKRQAAVLPYRALYLPTFSRFLMSIKPLSLHTLTHSLSLSPLPPPPIQFLYGVNKPLLPLKNPCSPCMVSMNP
jgi:hypothetical protein